MPCCQVGYAFRSPFPPTPADVERTFMSGGSGRIDAERSHFHTSDTPEMGRRARSYCGESGNRSLAMSPSMSGGRTFPPKGHGEPSAGGQEDATLLHRREFNRGFPAIPDLPPPGGRGRTSGSSSPESPPTATRPTASILSQTEAPGIRGQRRRTRAGPSRRRCPLGRPGRTPVRAGRVAVAVATGAACTQPSRRSDLSPSSGGRYRAVKTPNIHAEV
jgi:hypothetical protein